MHESELTDEHSVLSIYLSADAFCHHMVRALVGALLQVGDGTRPPGRLRQRLAEPTRESHIAITPAHGRIVEAVHYPPHDAVRHHAAQTRGRRDATTSSGD